MTRQELFWISSTEVNPTSLHDYNLYSSFAAVSANNNCLMTNHSEIVNGKRDNNFERIAYIYIYISTIGQKTF